jgi:hypothetical protein
MQKDIGNYTVNINFNSLNCWGLGFEYYCIFEYDLNKISDVIPIRIIGRVVRFDFLFFFINVTKYPKTVWLDSTTE